MELLREIKAIDHNANVVIISARPEEQLPDELSDEGSYNIHKEALLRRSDTKRRKQGSRGRSREQIAACGYNTSVTRNYRFSIFVNDDEIYSGDFEEVREKKVVHNERPR